ncbi:hypothetical protein RYX36_031071 [Vicia faba]
MGSYGDNSRGGGVPTISTEAWASAVGACQIWCEDTTELRSFPAVLMESAVMVREDGSSGTFQLPIKVPLSLLFLLFGFDLVMLLS